MSVLDRVIKFASSLLTEAAVSPIGDPDPDADLYRRITQSNRDLTPSLLLRSSKLASYMDQRNPIARRLINIMAEYVLGEGITVSAKDPAVDKLVKRFWNHPSNDWTVKGVDRFKDLRRYGEVLWKVVESPGMGTVTLMPIDVQYIDAVMWDAYDNPLAVVYRKYLGQLDYPQGSPSTRETLACIRIDAEKDTIGPAAIDITALSTPTLDQPGGTTPTAPTGGDPSKSLSPEQPLFTKPTGLCFYFAVNRPGGATRGLPDLFPLFDYLDAADQFIWTMMERARIASAMVYDVSVKGAQPEVDQETARIRKANPTKPGGVNVHSDTIVWQILTPKLEAAETETQMRAVMRVVLGGAGFPEYMFADAANTNRASAAEQGDPVTKSMTALQSHWISILNTLLRYQYQQAVAHGENLPKLTLDDPAPWKINTPDISAKDIATVGTVLTAVTNALAEGEAHGYISTDTARRAYLALLQLLGVEADAQEEADAIDKQPTPDPALGLYNKLPPTGLIASKTKAPPPEPTAPAGPRKSEGEIVADTLAAAKDLVAAAKPEASVTNVNVQPATAPDVKIEGANITVAPAAPGKVELVQPITVQPAAAPDVHVHEGDINVQPAAPANVIVEAQQIALETESIVENDKDGNPVRKVERVLKMGEA